MNDFVKSLLNGTTNQIPGRKKLLNEIANRSLLDVAPLTLISHLPLIQQSVEDTLFEGACRGLGEDLKRSLAELKRHSTRNWEVTELIDQFNKLCSSITLPLAEAHCLRERLRVVRFIEGLPRHCIELCMHEPEDNEKPNVEDESDGINALEDTVSRIFQEAALERKKSKSIRGRAATMVGRIRRVFGRNKPGASYDSLNDASRIVDETFDALIQREPSLLLTGAYGHLGKMLHSESFEHLNICKDKYVNIQPFLLRRAISIALILLRQNRRLVQFYVNRKISNCVANLEGRHKPELGGLITELAAMRMEGDGRDGVLVSPTDTKPWQVRLQWRRRSQYWTYSFIETFEKALDGAPPRTWRSPFFEEYTWKFSDPEVEHFIAALFSFWVPGGVLTAAGLEATSKSRLPFPGGLIVGAHYAFVPLGIMVAVLFFPELFFGKLKRRWTKEGEWTLPIWREGRLSQSEKDSWIKHIDENIERHLTEIEKNSAYGEFLRFVGSHSQSLREVAHLLSTRQASCLENSKSVAALMNLGASVRSILATADVQVRAKIGQALVEVTIGFWKLIEARHIFHEAPSRAETIGLGERNDYVACFVVDRAALYFTNFLPLGREMFTRTLFVDLGLGPFQRGRLALRLCNIAAYRSMCVKDIDRVRAILRGPDDNVRFLDELQGGEGVGFTESEESVTRRIALLGELDRIQEEMAQYDLFVTYGVRGQNLSTQSYMNLMRERVADVRQERIVGYPMLGDFLDRRMSQISREFERASSRYDELRERLQDLYGRIRTRLDSARASKQLDIQRAADIVVYIGATYYGYQIIKGIFAKTGLSSWDSGVVLAALLGVVFLLRKLIPLALEAVEAPLKQTQRVIFFTVAVVAYYLVHVGWQEAKEFQDAIGGLPGVKWFRRVNGESDGVLGESIKLAVWLVLLLLTSRLWSGHPKHEVTRSTIHEEGASRRSIKSSTRK